jgi:hypothetical protein
MVCCAKGVLCLLLGQWFDHSLPASQLASLAWQCVAVEACTGLRDSVGVKMRSKLFNKPPAEAVHHV